MGTAISVSLSSDSNELFYVDASGKITLYALSGNGVILSLDHGNLIATAGTSAPPGTAAQSLKLGVAYPIVAYNPDSNSALGVGVEETGGNLTSSVTGYDLTTKSLQIVNTGTDVKLYYF